MRPPVRQILGEIPCRRIHNVVGAHSPRARDSSFWTATRHRPGIGRHTTEAFMKAFRVSVVLVIVCAGFQLHGAAQRAAGRPLAIDDYYRMQTVASPSISPDGRWVVFTVAT